MPNLIKAFSSYLEKQNINHLHQLKQMHYQSFYEYTSSRANQVRGGGLSNNYVNKNLQAIDKFTEFMRHKGMSNVPSLGIKYLPLYTKPITVLTPEEIKSLYQATEIEVNTPQQEA